MRTIPKVGLAKLRSLRGRERLFAVIWGLARWFTVVLAVLGLTILIDWRVDKDRETPLALRGALTLLNAITAVVSGYYWLVRPWFGGPSLTRLARRVELGIPELEHRLVTAIELSGKDDPAGMSPELIDAVAREAEQIATRHSFARFADARRLKWAMALAAAPLLLSAAMLTFFGPELLSVLIRRQFLAAVDIPRFNQVENATPTLWPAGDEVLVEYVVTGKIRETDVGLLRVRPEGLPTDEYELTFAGRDADGHARFTARIPHSSVNFTHRAWVGDGRSRTAAEVRFEPRPVVTRIDAWVQLPRFLGLRPNGQPYETYQAQGEITGLAGSTARVRIAVQKPVSEARLTLIGRTPDGSGEVAVQRIPMLPGHETIAPNGDREYPAEIEFPLAANLIGYQVEVNDVHGFANATPPRRGIRIAPDEPPIVRLLPERYPEPGVKPSEEDIIEGLPIPLGGQIPIAYSCRSPQGVSRAQLRYRVNERGAWAILPLKERPADGKFGPFDPTIGTFADAPFGLQVEFHAVPSPDRDVLPDFLSGGGRFDFQTAELTKFTDDGRLTKLEVGDRVEYYVEVFDRNPAPNRPPGRSESRIKEILSPGEVLLRLDQTRQAESKIRDLEKRQREIFGRKMD